MSDEKRKPDLVRRVRKCKLAMWVEERTGDRGDKYKHYSLALQRSFLVNDEWKTQTMYLFPDQIQDIETLLQDFRLNHLIKAE